MNDSSLRARVVTLWNHPWFGAADPRSYALVRMGLAAVALLNLIDLWPHRHAFFAETGMIDLETLKGAIGSDPYYSLFHFITSESGVTAVFVLSALAMAFLGFGVLTRLSAIAVFIWHISYAHRAFPCMHGWDTVLRAYSFLLMVSPIASAWTVDRVVWRALRGSIRPVTSVPRYGLTLMQIQFAVIYINTVWLKLEDDYWRNGEFLSYFMMSIYARFPDPMAAREGAVLLSCVFTYATLLIELSLPFFLVFRRTRVLGFALGYGLHLSIAALSVLEIFSFAMLITYFAFLDPLDWKWLDDRWSKRRTAHPAAESPNTT